MPLFILRRAHSKKHSDSSGLATLVVNLVPFVTRGSDQDMKPITLMLRHFHMSTMPKFSFCSYPPEVKRGVLPPND